MNNKNEFSELMSLYSRVYLKEQDETTQKEPEITSNDIVDDVQSEIDKVNKSAEAPKGSSYEEIELDPDLDLDLSDIHAMAPNKGQTKTVWNHKLLETVISDCWKTKDSLLVFGDTGIGKSTSFVTFAEQKSKEMGRSFVNWNKLAPDLRNKLAYKIINNPEVVSKYFLFLDIRSVQLQPEDLQGIPDISDKSPFLKQKQPFWIWLSSLSGTAGILFLDEINQASPQMLSSLYEPTLDRTAGGTPFSKDVWVAAAGNEFDETGISPILSALMDRFTAGVLVLDPEVWVDYAYEKGMDPRILSFIEENPKVNLGMVDEAGNKFTRIENQKYPSPRSMFKFDKQFKNILLDYNKLNKEQPIKSLPADQQKKESDRRKAELRDRIYGQAGGICGDSWARRFIKFFQEELKFKVEKILPHAEAGTLTSQYKGGDLARITRYAAKYLKKGADELKKNNNNLTPEVEQIYLGVIKIIVALSENAEVNAILFGHLNRIFQGDQTALSTFKNYTINGSYDETLKNKYKRAYQSATDYKGGNDVTAKAKKASGV